LSKIKEFTHLDTETTLKAADSKREGYLWKTGQINTNFQRRLFKFDKDKFPQQLQYYKDDSSTPAGIIQLDKCTLYTHVPEDPTAFKLVSSGMVFTRTYIIKAEDNFEQEEWIHTITQHSNVKMSAEDREREAEKERKKAADRAAKRARKAKAEEERLIKEMGLEAYNKMLQEQQLKLTLEEAEREKADATTKLKGKS